MGNKYNVGVRGLALARIEVGSRVGVVSLVLSQGQELGLEFALESILELGLGRESGPWLGSGDEIEIEFEKPFPYFM